MRIGIDGRYINDHYPGLGRYTFHLIQALAKADPTTNWTVLWNPRAANTRHDISRLREMANVHLVDCPLPAVSIREQLLWPSLARRLGLELLHSPYYVKPYFLPCPSVVTIGDAIGARYPQHLPSAAARVVYRIATWLAIASARCVITFSASSQRDLALLFKVPPDKLATIPPGVGHDFTAVPDGDRDRQVRARYGLPQAYVFYLGINKPHKNLPGLMRAWSVVRRDRQSIGQEDVKLVAAGKEDKRYRSARQLGLSLGLGDSVASLGEVPEEDLPALYRLATAFVFPSLWEGFGLPVLEAMACGTPVACANSSSLPEVAGDAALLFDPASPGEIAKALLRLLGEPELRAERRQRGLARAKDFSWEKTALETLSVYRKAIERTAERGIKP